MSDDESFFADESAAESENDMKLQQNVATHLRQRRRATAKKNISKKTERKPTKHPSAPSISDVFSQDAEQMSMALDMLSKLPQQSSYARHRRSVLEKAVSLLKRKRRTSLQAEQLAGLLAQMELWRGEASPASGSDQKVSSEATEMQS